MTNTQSHVPDPTAAARPPADPLSTVLSLLKLQGTFYCQSRLSAPWGIKAPPFPELFTFFAVLKGRCWLLMDGAEARPFEQGSLVLVTSGAGYALADEATTAPVELEHLPIRKISDVYEMLDYGGGGNETRLMFGILRMDRAAGALLLDNLPEVIAVDTLTAGSGDWLAATMRFVAGEAGAMRPGAETVITRLADVVVVEAIRSWITSAPANDIGWLNGLRDPRIGKAISAIHGAPQENWTLARLADVAGVSRSAFSARFTDLVGMPAMRYLAYWRMVLARDRLLTTTLPIAAIAAELGYESEPSFSRAFSRVFAIPPGRLRRDAGHRP